MERPVAAKSEEAALPSLPRDPNVGLVKRQKDLNFLNLCLTAAAHPPLLPNCGSLSTCIQHPRPPPQRRTGLVAPNSSSGILSLFNQLLLSQENAGYSLQDIALPPVARRNTYSLLRLARTRQHPTNLPYSGRGSRQKLTKRTSSSNLNL
jgi:hypothetical protein